MVRKIIAVVLCIAAILAVPIAASAAAVDGDIPSDVLDIAKSLIEKEVGLNDDYVLFRYEFYDSFSEYMLLIGDISLNDSTFTCTSCKGFYIDVDTSNYSKYSLYSFDDYDGSFYAGEYLVFSNLGHYPDLIERSNYYEIAALIMLFAVVCIYLFRSIFSFCFRNRVY